MSQNVNFIVTRSTVDLIGNDFVLGQEDRFREIHPARMVYVSKSFLFLSLQCKDSLRKPVCDLSAAQEAVRGQRLCGTKQDSPQPCSSSHFYFRTIVAPQMWLCLKGAELQTQPLALPLRCRGLFPGRSRQGPPERGHMLLGGRTSRCFRSTGLVLVAPEPAVWVCHVSVAGKG